MNEQTMISLAQLLARHSTTWDRDGLLECGCESPMLNFGTYADWIIHVVEDIDATFMVVHWDSCPVDTYDTKMDNLYERNNDE
jgi:hypothetical protein